jgi:choline dehydrogenase-like flavoprotein
LTSHTRKRRAGVARLGDFHAVVVGSGFSGAVAAARLAPAGFAILERGRRWPGDRSLGT